MAQSPDFIVIGSGIAGVRAAIELAPLGRVAVLTKSRTAESNTEYAQGGIAVVLNDDDEISLHYQDTLIAGDDLCDETAVQTLVNEGPERIEELIGWGTAFDRDGTKLAFTQEAAHSRRRILHARGDSTGQEINRTLIQRIRQMRNARLYPHCCALELIVESRGCTGVRYLDTASGTIRELRAGAVMLATGGSGRLFRETTNPKVATGDGFALALRAGAALADMEFVQFHPTALKLDGAPQFLLSEALRGEGALLRNAAGQRFMKRYHPDAELAPRDVVSRAIFEEARKRRQSSMFLDLTHLDAGFLKRRFPKIYQTCLSFGLDVTRDQIPVFPAAHYMMGGVYTDLDGHTSVAGLYAAGEVACLGVHGANRLASNSLLEGLVFGQRAGRAMAAARGRTRLPGRWFRRIEIPSASGPTAKAKEIRGLMTRQVGIVRCGRELTRALKHLHSLQEPSGETQADAETRSLLQNGRIIAAAALLRTESRGAHFRSDHPDRDDKRWKKHLLVRSSPGGELRWYRTSTLQRQSTPAPTGARNASAPGRGRPNP